MYYIKPLLILPNDNDYEVLNLFDFKDKNKKHILTNIYLLIKKNDNNGIYMYICKFLLGRLKYKEYSNLPPIKEQANFIADNIDRKKINKYVYVIIKNFIDLNTDEDELLISEIKKFDNYYMFLFDNSIILNLNYSKIKNYGWRPICEWIKEKFGEYPIESFHLLHYVKKFSINKIIYELFTTFYYYGIGCNINLEKAKKIL
jgi:hypothetical protein